MYQRGEHSAGIDCAQLGRSPTRTTLARASRAGDYQFVQGERPDQAGFVDDHQLARSKPPSGYFAFDPHQLGVEGGAMSRRCRESEVLRADPATFASRSAY